MILKKCFNGKLKSYVVDRLTHSKMYLRFGMCKGTYFLYLPPRWTPYQQTVNGMTTKYHVMNGTLLGQTKGSDTIVFLYDEKANRYGFDYNGTKYYYIFNVQGDVIGILNQAGQKIVSYTYDPWGKVLSVDGSEASTIGQINPIATAATTTIPKPASIIYSQDITIRLLEGS